MIPKMNEKNDPKVPLEPVDMAALKKKAQNAPLLKPIPIENIRKLPKKKRAQLQELRDAFRSLIPSGFDQLQLTHHPNNPNEIPRYKLIINHTHLQYFHFEDETSNTLTEYTLPFQTGKLIKNEQIEVKGDTRQNIINDILSIQSDIKSNQVLSYGINT